MKRQMERAFQAKVLTYNLGFEELEAVCPSLSAMETHLQFPLDSLHVPQAVAYEELE
jgi:hypothetical protein